MGRRHTIWDPHSQTGDRRVERGKRVSKEGRSVLRGGFLRGIFCRPRKLRCFHFPRNRHRNIHNITCVLVGESRVCCSNCRSPPFLAWSRPTKGTKGGQRARACLYIALSLGLTRTPKEEMNEYDCKKQKAGDNGMDKEVKRNERRCGTTQTKRRTARQNKRKMVVAVRNIARKRSKTNDTIDADRHELLVDYD